MIKFLNFIFNSLLYCVVGCEISLELLLTKLENLDNMMIDWLNKE